MYISTAVAQTANNRPVLSTGLPQLPNEPSQPSYPPSQSTSTCISRRLSADMAGTSDVVDGPSFTAFALSMVVISAATVLLRLTARGIAKELRWDDWLVLVALVFSVIQNAFYIHVEELGIGKHADAVKDASRIVESLKMLWISDFFANAALALARCSVLFLYARALAKDGAAIRYTIWTLQALNAAWWTWSVIASCLVCSPVSRYWDPAAGGSCRDVAVFDLAVTIPSIAIDMALILFPVVVLDHLRHKLLIALTLVLALAAPASSLGRLVVSNVDRQSSNQDFTHHANNELFWAAVEAPAIIIASSLPAIYTLFRRAVKSISSADAGSAAESGGGGTSHRNNSAISFSKAQVSPTKFLRSPISKPKLHPLYTHEEWPRDHGTRDDEARDQATPLEKPTVLTSERPSPKRKRRSFRILSLYLGNEASFGEQVRNDLNLQSSRRASTAGSGSASGSPGRPSHKQSRRASRTLKDLEIGR